MSSDGSVASSSSRIRQFGLYRTIDARTEEFLRSSRKRQIRQGCACAAISTAITVTVVVSVILVYEYSINSESNSNKKVAAKPNWIGLMNESDITSLGSKFNKKINFDRTTLKLLPILLKALNKNRYLEKILEDYSSSSPPHTVKEPTEATFTRNVFSDSKNWLKMPSSRLYTVDYKTSPLAYWKSPTQRLEYLTKIRKIRDYQRMLNYFDKMINDKVGSNTKKDFEYTENPLKAETVPMKKDKIQKNKELRHPLETIKTEKEFRINNTKDSEGCKCPKKLGQLLGKLISSIQNIIPRMANNKPGVHRCGNKTNVSTEAPVTISKFITPTTRQPSKKERINDFIRSMAANANHKMIHNLFKKSTTPPKLTTFFKKRTSTTYASTATSTSSTYASTATSTSSSTRSTSTNPISRTTESVACCRNTFSRAKSNNPRTTTTNTLTTTESSYIERKSFDESTIKMEIITNSLVPNSQAYETNILDYDLILKPTDKTHIETSKSPEKHTTMFMPIKFIDSSNEVHSNEKMLDPVTVQSPSTRAIIPLYREDDYEDSVTTSKTINNYERLDVHSMELLKSKTRFSNDNEFETRNSFKKLAMETNPLNYHSAIRPKDFELSPMRKMTEMIYLPHEQITKEWKYTIEPKESVPYPEDTFTSTLQPQSNISNSVESNISINSANFLSSLKNSTHIKNSESDLKSEHLDTTLSPDPGSAENEGEEEFQDEYKTESRTGIPYKYKKTTKITTVIANQTNAWDMLKNEEKVTIESPKSMLPSMRPLYLEVQRNNDWKQDDHPDYDMNFNNNIFDFPNIN